jgi:CRISPR-associated endonuclease/helicase Cas3
MPTIAPWGKIKDGISHHLAHHCADVAACFEAITALPVVRDRMSRAAGRPLSLVDMARLSVLAFLHDAGKLHPGFQAKGWPKGAWAARLHGHVKEGAAIFSGVIGEKIACNLHIVDLVRWGVDEHLLFSILAHHGRPFRLDEGACKRWQGVPALGYDPVAASVEMGAMVRHWFADAFTNDHTKLPTEAGFQHLLCGFVSLADWLGSTQKIFPFEAIADPDYMIKARERAIRATVGVGIDVRTWRECITGRTSFAAVAGKEHPRPQQKLVGDFPLDEQLMILEAETGSGKTEAALWRFAKLFEAGLVDSLYFALPTRAAAIQIHGRVSAAMSRIFGQTAPGAVLVVPGYLRAGEVDGKKLPDWEVRWDDDGGADEQKLLARWAAESTKRALAATIAVGTVDQVMLAALQVKHAHLRGAALSRSLLVIDEVHASDRYMTEVQTHLLKIHLKRGGHAMLMSATLGSVARARWQGYKRTPSFSEAVGAPYPAVWGEGRVGGHGYGSQERQKAVTMTLAPSMGVDVATRLALAAAKQDARVLIIRNTVAAAIATFEAVRQSGAEDLLLRVTDAPALHHSRFAPEDRECLDRAVEAALSPNERNSRGVIVVGTQTLEQSLDIDADILITDLCPVDVLLQRMGRLHRHNLARPSGFEMAQCHVMVPEGGLEKLLVPSFENGLGLFKNGGGIYRDVSVLELTRRLIANQFEWTIPAMNRFLVESATHPERIEALHGELGKAWADYWNNIYGRDVAEAGAANGIALPTGTPFADVLFPENEERIRTRLGGEGARILFNSPIVGPFGRTISSLTLPSHWSHGIETCAPIEPMAEAGVLRFLAGKAKFRYDRRGLVRDKS